MEKLVFDRIESKLNLDTETLSLSKGKVSSPLFAADFKGKLHTTVPCRLSRIQLTGSFHPRPEFTSSLDSPSLVNMLKKETLKGNLPFTVNGLLQEPGIMFTTLPPAFNNMMGLQKKKSRHVPERSR
ncbi:MAG: hypothetical protein D3909_16090 [Candidatus Electrothrix sp. ATG1]|nr:hypothetical protein [Candidatus Electrothrix sp. ATG1]